MPLMTTQRTNTVPGWVAVLIHQARDPRDPIAAAKAKALLIRKGYGWTVS